MDKGDIIIFYIAFLITTALYISSCLIIYYDINQNTEFKSVPCYDKYDNKIANTICYDESKDKKHIIVFVGATGGYLGLLIYLMLMEYALLIHYNCKSLYGDR